MSADQLRGRRSWSAALAALIAVTAGAPTGYAFAEPVTTRSLDVTLRERATYASAVDYDESSSAAGWFWTQRLNAVGVIRRGGLAAQLNLQSALLAGSVDSPIERNVLDAQEAWVQFGVDESFVRAGRQELKLGSQRLIGWRDGTNVRRAWDGIRARVPFADWQVDAFALQLVEVDSTGAFNDDSDAGRRLAGLYGTTRTRWTDIDLYLLYTRFKGRATAEGRANQERFSVGARAFGGRGRWFWNWEAVLQAGRQGAADIAAWTLATNTGRRFAVRWQPAVMVSVNVASGDDEPGDGTLRTFDALFPRGSYFSELAQLGPANFYNINPYFTLQPRDDVAISVDLDLYWRLETADGVYGPPGNLLRAPGGSRERFVNTALSATLEWEPSDRHLVGLTLTRSRPEAFLDETGPAADTNFAEFTFEMRF